MTVQRAAKGLPSTLTVGGDRRRRRTPPRAPTRTTRSRPACPASHAECRRAVPGKACDRGRRAAAGAAIAPRPLVRPLERFVHAGFVVGAIAPAASPINNMRNPRQVTSASELRRPNGWKPASGCRYRGRHGAVPSARARLPPCSRRERAGEPNGKFLQKSHDASALWHRTCRHCLEHDGLARNLTVYRAARRGLRELSLHRACRVIRLPQSCALHGTYRFTLESDHAASPHRRGAHRHGGRDRSAPLGGRHRAPRPAPSPQLPQPRPTRPELCCRT